MNDPLREQIAQLEQAVEELGRVSRRALGFIATIEYRGTTFHISPRFVIADLQPIAFLRLVEHYDEPGDTPEDAVARLYERVEPLLLCRHDWAPLSRVEDDPIRGVAPEEADGSLAGAYICKICTAYALGTPLPLRGRTFASAEE